ncbi:MAG: right-handed parallel beta-helix repeat-containing protein [Deltaproteobacteria bacterium]|nr:right-handed parallel beta-helix repeat-containing protein [Deltaproteobacteria bacterium]
MTRMMRFFLSFALLSTGCGSDDTGASPGGGAGSPGVDGSADASPPVTVASCAKAFQEPDSCASKTVAGKTWYVSTAGDDTNDGLSEAKPLKTLAAASKLQAGPGDRILLKCGDTWQAETLTVTRSGSECNHLIVGSYPPACSNPPVLSGSLPITGWTPDSGSVYVADLNAGDNAGRFPKGINQLFRGEERLSLGRWPNMQDPAYGKAGYSYIDGAPAPTTLQDNELPDVDWTGAVLRAKTIRWLLLNRKVVGSSSKSLTLNSGLSCWDGCGPANASSHGWGYHLTHHRATLDQEGEWYYDEAASKVYLFSATAPSSIEGSVLPADLEKPDETPYTGPVVLGNNLKEHITWVVVENLSVKNSFANGITLPVNLEKDDHSNVVIRCNKVKDVEGIGISLATWVWNAGEQSGWRGGHDIVVSGNVVDGANHFGIHTYAYRATFQDNVIRNIGLLKNLNRSGLGCDYEGDNCTEHGGGIHVVVDQPALSSHSSTFRGNVVDTTGYCGFDVFGSSIAIEQNAIRNACATKGDCGGVRLFGGDSLSSTAVHDVTLTDNVLSDIRGVTEGDATAFEEEFGFGLYIDHNSRDIVASGNTVARVTGAGILLQDSTGTLQDNTVFAAVRGHVVVTGAQAKLSGLTHNVLFSLSAKSACLSAAPGQVTGSDSNYFFNPFAEACIDVGSSMTLAAWQSSSGQDASSKAAWYQESGATPRAEVFINDTASATTVTLSKSYKDLDQKPVTGSLALEPFRSRVLVAD